MEGCCTVAVSLELSSSFPTLLRLSTKGKGFGSSFRRGCAGAVRCQKLRGVAGQGWGLPQEPCPKVPQGSGDNVATRTPGCPQPPGSHGHGLVPWRGGPPRASFSWELVPLGVLALG